MNETLRLERSRLESQSNNNNNNTLRLERTLKSQSSSLIDCNYIYIYFFKEWFLPISLVLNRTINFSFSFTVLLWLEH